VAVILQQSDCDAIRAAIDVTLDASDVPDTVIMMSIYADRAERWMAAQIPDFATRLPPESDLIRDSLILYCASLLVPVSPLFKSEVHPEFEYTRPDIDPLKKQNQLASDAAGVVDPIVVLLSGMSRPTMFTVVSAVRGR
jgi:hypothetical protein